MSIVSRFTLFIVSSIPVMTWTIVLAREARSEVVPSGAETAARAALGISAAVVAIELLGINSFACFVVEGLPLGGWESAGPRAAWPARRGSPQAPPPPVFCKA